MITNILTYLEESADKYPGKIVFSDINSKITYAEAVDCAKRIGTKLFSSLKVKNRPVAVLIDRNVESLVEFMGVAYSGNFYVPIDPHLPAERIKSMLNTLSPIAVLGTKEQIEETNVYDIKTFIYSEFMMSDMDEIVLRNIRHCSIDTDPLYAIFTSGSTGNPKAVLVSHRSVIDLVDCFEDSFGFSSEDVFGNQAPFDFDVSVKDIYNTLRNGASMEIIPKEYFSFPIKLIDYLNERKITVAIWATTALCIVANLRAMKKTRPQFLKKVMFSGEVMPIKVFNYWKENIPEAMYVNLYGPTEITCNCTYFKVEKDYEVGEVLPIGKPFRNTDIIVLNDKDQLVSGNEIGELCVRGTSLALGYYNDMEKTKNVFCQNPLNKAYPELIYRTGDLVKYNEDGELVYCARKDFQIKHMGHRIELGEIEVAADALGYVERSCCLYDEEKEKIVLIYQSDCERNDEIIEALSSMLPKYMVPTKLIDMRCIPLNKNSKIDRVKLKQKYIVEEV